MSNIKNLPAVSSEASFSMYLREINKIPSLTKEEEFLLAKAYLENQDLEAAHKLVTSHLKLVAKIAMRYRNYGLPITELVSEGNIGLMQAVKKYDPDLGYRLSTYSMWWIKASIQEYVLKSWSLVKIGTTSAQKKLFFSLSKIKHKITNMYSRSVNEGDYQAIADELGVTVREVNEMSQRLSGPDLSLNRTINNDSDNSGSEMLELLPESKPSQEDILSRRQILVNKTQILSEALGELNEREVQILTARKLNDSPLTLDTLSSQYNISKERVRQIETKAFEKVQNYVLTRISNDGQIKTIDY
ncbi:MAG: RNA polymerase sigma factor RpoH [Rickettsiaceae bacterium]|jgi:RNA polymerase sigma-32 factor|nr:RNA polymerase sigma factor RpoH [Rickettsiaceae bacterium]